MNVNIQIEKAYNVVNKFSKYSFLQIKIQIRICFYDIHVLYFLLQNFQNQAI